MENHDKFVMAQFLANLPDRDPLGDITNMRRNLERALACARNGDVLLTEGEIKHWIEGIDRFLGEQQPTRDSEKA
jgi:hypothetical protein